jgi:RHS repeat-associated protein
MPDGEGWDRIEYAYDAAGRRIEKKVDGTTQVKYVYDGDHIIAEYNNAGTLLRKYVHGPCVDEPICMIEAGGAYAGTHYYHYDALGSCVAMTNSAGNVAQLYEYSVYGQVAASDADHPNRFMFTGREFDKDTGLYHYRARYYHPEIGRFLQTDPIGYGDGMNRYRYCRNGPVALCDPTGTDSCEIRRAEPPYGWDYDFSPGLEFLYTDDLGVTHIYGFSGVDALIGWLAAGEGKGIVTSKWIEGEVGWKLVNSNAGATNTIEWFWRLKVLMWLDGNMAGMITEMEQLSQQGKFFLELNESPYAHCDTRYVSIGDGAAEAKVYYNPKQGSLYEGGAQNWYGMLPLVGLAHELTHAYIAAKQWNCGPKPLMGSPKDDPENEAIAIRAENAIRRALFGIDYNAAGLYPRPGHSREIEGYQGTPKEAWQKYDPWKVTGK